MEVRITINDGGVVISSTPSAAPVTAPSAATPATSTSTTGGAIDAGSSTSTSLSPTGLSSEVLARAAAMGAIDAGPAPNSGNVQTGAPMPFITGRTVFEMASATNRIAAESAGAAPGTEGLVPTFTAPEGK